MCVEVANQEGRDRFVEVMLEKVVKGVAVIGAGMVRADDTQHYGLLIIFEVEDEGVWVGEWVGNEVVRANGRFV